MIWCIKTYMIAYVKIQKKWRYTIQYVKPTAQLVFKNRFPKGGQASWYQTIIIREQDTIGKPKKTELIEEHIYIYTYINTELLDGNKGDQEETHHPTHRFWRLFLDLLSMGWRGCASGMGAIKLPPACSSPKIMSLSSYSIITYAV